LSRSAALIAAVVVVVAAIGAAQLLLPPVVGMADNGDFPRIMGYFSIGYAPGLPHQEHFTFVTTDYVVHPANRWVSGFLSSELLLAAAAFVVSRPFLPGNAFDIRWLGGLHLAILLAAIWLALHAARDTALVARVALAAGLTLAFTDVSYVAYFNSFYSEPASLLFLLCLPSVAALTLAAEGRRQLLLFLGFVVLACLFISAKPQNATGGLFLAGYVLLLRRLRRDRPWRTAAAIAVALLLVCSAVTYAATTRIVRHASLHFAVFHELLGHSPHPERDLAELGLAPELIVYAGTHPWQFTPPSFENPRFIALFLDRITMARIALFYARHPGRLVDLLDRSAGAALAARPDLGNFTRASGRPPYALSERAAAWTWVKSRSAPSRLSSLSAMLGVLVVLAVIWSFRAGSARTRLMAALILALLGTGIAQFVTVAITSGTIDTAKHMFLFRAIIDLVALLVPFAIVAGLGAVRDDEKRVTST
jgi:hypothetical protein